MHLLLVGPGHAWMCFCPAKTRKNLELSEMHTNLWQSAQVWFRHKRRKLVIASRLLLCIGGYSCLRYWIQFFSAVFHVLDWSFFVLHFDGNVLNWFPKVIWPRKDWFWGFLSGNGFLPSSTSYLYGLNSARIAQLLFFFDDIIFVRCSVWGVFWSVL